MMTERITKGLRYIDGVLYIGDGNVTAEVGIGITSGIQIDQGASDDAFIVVKSSDIAHGYTGQADTDTFLYYKKVYATGGGVHMQVMGENSANPVNYIVDSRGGQAETTKSTAGRSLIEFHATQHNGSNAIASVTADGNVFGIRARAGGAWATVFIVDEDGDLWLNGGIVTDGISIGASASGQFQNRFSGDFTSTASASTAFKTYVDGRLTGEDSNINSLSIMRFNADITTPDNSITIGRVNTLEIMESPITSGTDTITIASTVYIHDSPSEGVTNASLYVADGDTNLDTVTLRGTLTVGGQTFDAGAGDVLINTTGAKGLKIVSTNNAASGAVIELRQNSATPAADDKVGIIYAYGQNDAAAEKLYGFLHWEATAINDGSEDGTLEFFLANGADSGANNKVMYLTGAGALGADGAFTEFDEYDDHALISVKGHELDRLCEVGVMTKKPLGEDGKVMGSGYMLNLQNAIYLGWGGIKQNRAKIDDLEDRLSRAGI